MSPHPKNSPAAAATDPPQEEAPLARVWEEPAGTGEPVAFDPDVYEPPLSPEEIEELLGEDQG